MLPWQARSARYRVPSACVLWLLCLQVPPPAPWLMLSPPTLAPSTLSRSSSRRRASRVGQLACSARLLRHTFAVFAVEKKQAQAAACPHVSLGLPWRLAVWMLFKLESLNLMTACTASRGACWGCPKFTGQCAPVPPRIAGATQFGSGWAWLVVGKDGKLKVTKTPNAENPWIHGETPILTMDGECPPNHRSSQVLLCTLWPMQELRRSASWLRHNRVMAWKWAMPSRMWGVG
jgi:hypothetical protein